MSNAWSLLYDEIYGDEEMTDNTITSLESDEYDPIVTVGSGNTASASPPYFVDTTEWENISIDTSNCPVTLTGLSTDQLYATPPYVEDPICSVNMDDLIFAGTEEYETLNINIPDDYPSAFTAFSDNDDAIAHHITTPTPGIDKDCTRKYKEDESIEALKNYISTTYCGHYTSDNNSVQTLDLIQSVGDAESFCRSNAIKYLSRYDKRGQAKRDILKAMHYCLLLYYFSGQTNETPTRGYETF